MTISLKIERKLDNNNVLVNLESNKVGPRFFKVPESRADEFCSKYKKFNKEETIFSYIKILIPTILCCALGSNLAKNLNAILRNIIAVGAGIIGGSVAMPLNIKDIAMREKRLLKAFEAEEINFINNITK